MMHMVKSLRHGPDSRFNRTENSSGAPLRIQLLAEGDAETRDSWSGSTHSLLVALRRLGHDVNAANVSSSRAADLLSKAVSFSPRRATWAAHHHYGPFGFRDRSRRAGAARSSQPPNTRVIQIGATFDATRDGRGATYCYCDANAIFASRAAEFSPVRRLSPAAFTAMVERERSVYTKAAGIFAMSEALRQSFIHDFAIPPERVVTAPAGPNMERFPSDAERYTAKNTPPTVLFVGRQFERKGGPMLLNAFRQLRKILPDARLLIAGCSPDVGDTPGVTILGALPSDHTGPGSLTAAYQMAHLFCMPSHYEPFGVVFVEAMMHGLPCVAANAWAMPELVQHERTGWLVRDGDCEELARILVRALGDLPRLRRMGAAAHTHASTTFSWSRTAKIMADVLAGGAE